MATINIDLSKCLETILKNVEVIDFEKEAYQIMVSVPSNNSLTENNTQKIDSDSKKYALLDAQQYKVRDMFINQFEASGFRSMLHDNNEIHINLNNGTFAVNNAQYHLREFKPDDFMRYFLSSEYNHDTMKEIISGEAISCRFSRNSLPNTAENSNAYFRRFLFISFIQKIISSGLSAILKWVLKGMDQLLKKQILSALNVIMCFSISCSGSGLFPLVRMASPNLHKQYFDAFVDYSSKLKIEIDKSGSDMVRLKFVSSDENYCLNEDSVVLDTILTPRFPAYCQNSFSGDADIHVKTIYVVYNYIIANRTKLLLDETNGSR